jgi:hypothetical protein
MESDSISLPACKRLCDAAGGVQQLSVIVAILLARRGGVGGQCRGTLRHWVSAEIRVIKGPLQHARSHEGAVAALAGPLRLGARRRLPEILVGDRHTTRAVCARSRLDRSTQSGLPGGCWCWPPAERGWPWRESGWWRCRRHLSRRDQTSANLTPSSSARLEAAGSTVAVGAPREMLGGERPIWNNMTTWAARPKPPP